MLLNARQMAYLGLLLAICEVLLYLSAVLSINTLALLFLAACCVGVACALSSAAGGGVFFLASLLLGLVLIPNKLYLLTYTGLGVYVLLLEGVQPRMLLKCPAWSVWLVKLGAFNLVYIPLLIFAPQMIYSGNIPVWLMAGLIVAGNVVMVVFDYLYLKLEGKYGARIQALARRR